MKKPINQVLRIGVLLAVVLFLLMGNIQPVQAAVCIWSGGISSDWGTANNWTNCGGAVPGSGDDVTIGDVSTAPVLNTTASVTSLIINSKGSLTIGSGATLTVGEFDLLGKLSGAGDLVITGSMGWYASAEENDGLMDGSGTTTLNSGASLSFPTQTYEKLGRTFINYGVINQRNAYGLTVDREGVLINYGTINVYTYDDDMTLFKRKENPGSGRVENLGSIVISDRGAVLSQVQLNNSGTIQMETGVLTLTRSGTHSGSIIGQAGSTVMFSNPDSLSAVVHTFENDSSVEVSNVLIDGTELDVSGTFNIATAPGTNLTCSGGSELIFHESANIGGLSEKIQMSDCHISLPASFSGLVQPELELNSSSQLTNLGSWSISKELLWNGGIVDGIGTTTILADSSYRMGGVGGCQLNSQHLINQTTAEWQANTLTLSNDARYTNQGTFNAQSTASMNGGTNGVFDNQGTFVKSTEDTITTMDIDFSNKGIIKIEAGRLVFPNGLTSENGTEIVLEGELETSTPLDLQGARLSGNGMIDGDLNNTGSVVPGDSPGKITVTGDYTQTPAGSLRLEIGGITAETDSDILIVQGAAALAGKLEVSLWDGFTPAVGDQFEVLNFASVSGDFETVMLPDLPAGQYWIRTFSETTLRLTIDEHYQVFIPFVVR